MSERYDMDHVYYIDGKDAHGAEKYYEYPNVFAAVLIGKLLGLTIPADADFIHRTASEELRQRGVWNSRVCPCATAIARTDSC